MDLSPRYLERKEQLKASVPIGTRDFLRGYFEGYKRAVRLVHPTAEDMFSQERLATEVTLLALAIEETMKEAKEIDGF